MFITFRPRLYLTVVLVLSFLTLCLAQDQGARSPVPAKTSLPIPSPTPVPNGIGVGRPKVFDNRTLTLMLESLSESLRTSQTSFINQQALATALGYIQGYRSRDFVSNLQLSTLPIPGVKQENIANTGNATATGSPLPDSGKQTTTTTRDALNPTAPTLETLPAFSGFSPTYGENASDLLSDQVNLTYQIFNLRMLLERSLSDRIWEDSTRRQAVLGFNVTLDPPRTAEDAVAVVEITLNACANGETDSQCKEGGCSGPACKMDGLSLVSLMPQEKTYNAASLSTKSHAFGGAAVAKVFQVGYSQKERSQTFYLYRDTDTLSYERMDPEHPNQIIFGWMFRPVLGRRSVSPGMRQLFSIVAMPATDKVGDQTDQTKDISQWLHASVRTYWKKYDHETQTSFENPDANRSSRLKYALSFNWLKPEIFASRYTNLIKYTNIEVKPTKEYQAQLEPMVKKIWWVPVGAKSALVSVEGNNFFSGTQVVMGDKAYVGPADGLILKSHQGFDLTTSLDALAVSQGAIIGRYSTAVPLIASDSKGGTPYDGIVVEGRSLGPSLAGNRLLEINLYGLVGSAQKELQIDQLPKAPNGQRLSPIVSVNDKVASLPYNLYNDGTGKLVLQANIPDSMLANGGGIVKVSWPFLSDKWSGSYRIYDPASVFQVIRLTANSIVITSKDWAGFTIDPTSPTGITRPFCWHVRAGDSSVDLNTPACVPVPPIDTTEPEVPVPKRRGEKSKKKGTEPKTKAANPDRSERISSNAVAVTLTTAVPDKIVLIAPYGTIWVLDVPKATTPPAEAKFIALNQNDSVWIDIAVDDNDKVGFVEANRLSLPIRKPTPDKDHKTIQVQVTRDLTSLANNEVDLTILAKDGSFLGKTKLRISCGQSCNNGGKQ